MLIGHLSCVLLRGPYRDLDLIGSHIGDNDDTHGDQPDNTEDKQEDCNRDGRKLEPQTESEGFFVNLLDRVHDLAMLRQDIPEYSTGCSRYDCHGNDKRCYKAVRYRQCHGNEKFPHSTAGKYHREKDADGRHGRSNNSSRDLFCTLNRRPWSSSLSAAESENVLYDNDRVVNQHTDAQRQA